MKLTNYLSLSPRRLNECIYFCFNFILLTLISGGLLIVLLIIIMWFPLAFMSIVQTVAGIANAPKEVKVSLSLEGFSDIFTDYSVGKNLRKWEEQEFKDLNQGFIQNLGAQQMLSRYDHGDLFSVKGLLTSRGKVTN